MQQQKTHIDGIGNDDFASTSFAKLASSEKSTLTNISDSTHLSSLKSSEDELNRRIIVPSFSQSNFASENALLHQLLTNQDRSAFKPPNNSSLASNANSTVIKLNDGYLNLPNDLPSNHMSLGNHVKNDKESHSNGASLFSGAEKLGHNNNLDLAESIIDHENEENSLVECLVCQKKFKTLSALNGHMRLHGGYFKMNYLLASKPGDGQVDKIDEQNV